MAKAYVSVTIDGVEDKVEILSTRVSPKRDELMIRLSKPWYDLSIDLRSALFQISRFIGKERHPGLEEGWTPSFLDPSD